jgi:hypothetical protein
MSDASRGDREGVVKPFAPPTIFPLVVFVDPPTKAVAVKFPPQLLVCWPGGLKPINVVVAVHRATI